MCYKKELMDMFKEAPTTAIITMIRAKDNATPNSSSTFHNLGSCGSD
jgi:hypothetical protein